MKLDPDKDYQQPHICHILIFLLSRNVLSKKEGNAAFDKSLFTSTCKLFQSLHLISLTQTRNSIQKTLLYILLNTIKHQRMNEHAI